MIHRDLTCPFTAGRNFRKAFEYSCPPEGEVRYPLGEQKYYREVWECEDCGHFVSIHEMDLRMLYENDYVASTYGALDGVRSAFARITGLPPERSDNIARVSRVHDFVKGRFSELASLKLLDVGAGIGVFGHEMKKRGFGCAGIEPDPVLARHLSDDLGIEAIIGHFGAVSIERGYDLITFNKVLEHALDPVKLLRQSRDLLNPGGIVYIELPDGESAAADSRSNGRHREEFDIDHFHVFSMTSFSLLVKSSGFRLLLVERVREPSSKFTLRGFMEVA